MMINSTHLLQNASLVLLQDAAERDRITARRLWLLNILWQERFLTREHLIMRVEAHLGKGCFGLAAWEDTFYRDMRIVRNAFAAAGFQLRYRRSFLQPGYYLLGEPAIALELAAMLAGSIAEIDSAQLAVFQRLSPAQRFEQGAFISDLARSVVAYRTLHRKPGMTLSDADIPYVDEKV